MRDERNGKMNSGKRRWTLCPNHISIHIGTERERGKRESRKNDGRVRPDKAKEKKAVTNRS